MSYHVGEYSIIESENIGRGTKIWNYVHVMPGASIGEDCTIGDHVLVGRDVSIGHRCKIEDGAKLFEGVIIHDDVFIGPGVLTTNTHKPNPFTKAKSYGGTVISSGASICAGAILIVPKHGYLFIGKNALVGAGAVVTKNVPPNATVYGNPARVIV